MQRENTGYYSSVLDNVGRIVSCLSTDCLGRVPTNGYMVPGYYHDRRGS